MFTSLFWKPDQDGLAGAVQARTHADWLPELLAANPPAKPILRKEIPGRAGWVSCEAE